MMYPQLVHADNVGGSDMRVDTPMILRYSVWTGGDTVQESASPVYSGLLGPELRLANWSVTTATGQSAAECAKADDKGNVAGCFAGDYKYGGFYRKNGTTLRFFTPWSGASTAPTDGGVIGGFFAHGGIIDISP